MRNFLFTFLFASFLLFTSTVKAQYIEVGGMVGGTSYYGDLQKTKPELGSFGSTVSVMARSNRSSRYAFRAAAMYGSFNATDGRNSGSLRLRNLETQTSLYELSVCAEYNLIPYDIIDGQTHTPYLFLGVGGLYFNPQGRYQGKFIDLRPLGTEGQFLTGTKTYSPFQVVIPMGFGFKMALKKRLSVGFEFGIRQTFTDYLDDISTTYPNLDALSKINTIAAEMSYKTPLLAGQSAAIEGVTRGDKNKNDRYYSLGVTMTYSLASPQKMEYDNLYRQFINF
ncbi:MAG: DUF6089 family protein [Saprospiraceae bacterium]|nr:DUF6089 family protein [Saprospiraceae bacterium]